MIFKISRFTKGLMTGMLIGLIAVWILFSCQSCGSDLATGIGIGAGTSVGLSEAEKLAKESKAALVGEIIELRAQLEQATDPAEILALETKLAALQYKANIVESVEQICNTAVETVTEIAERDWVSKDPETQEENIHWIVHAAFGAYLTWLARKKKVLETGIGKFQGKTETSGEAKELHDEIRRANKSLWPSAN